MKINTFLLSLLIVWASVTDAYSGRLAASSNKEKVEHVLKNQKYVSTFGRKQINNNATGGVIVENGRATCDQDYSPCSCSVNVVNNTNVQCYGDVQTIRDTFQRVNSSSEIFTLSLGGLTDEYSGISLPVDFLGNARVINIEFSCSDYGGSQGFFTSDPLAFRSTANSTVTFYMERCNFRLQPDFNFLTGFDRLESLEITYSASNFTAFQYLPPLPALQQLSISYTSGLNDIIFPDLSPAKLKILYLRANSITYQTADQIVARLVASTSADSLQEFYLEESLRRIPNQFGSGFTQLKKVDLSGNSILQFPASSFTCPSPYLQYLNLAYNGLRTIESGAFQGNFTMAQVDLSSNELAVFEEGVFKEMLQQMISAIGPQGYVKIYNNRFECGCDLAWFVRDNRHLLPVVQNGICDRDTSPYPNVPFERLNPESFADCPP